MHEHKGDFSAETRLLWISALAVGVGFVCALLAKILLTLITIFTNLFYHFHDLPNAESWLDFHSPSDHGLGVWAVLVPVVGGLIVGLMARYGSDRIRGHGIPEAIEAILIGQSRMQPKVALLKPLSSAISIGSGGPFGAEGPIIMTGGATGSIIAQMFQMTAAERKTLLVAGAAGGMSATFGTPVAAVLLAVELLLFEWKPRSLIPVALASAMAAMARPILVDGKLPLFPPEHMHGALSAETLVSAALVGLAAGALSMLLTAAVYGAEDAFSRLPIHWMWWPLIGGLVVGVGGYFEPRALGVGYDIIETLLKGEFPIRVLIGLVVVKAVIWSIALGSGTSGGVLAPLLIMGSSLGALMAGFLPGNDAALWSLVGLAAILGGTMRAPLTGVVFALEVTYDVRTLPALLIGSTIAYAFSVLAMKRSILTEKVARRGHHVTGEYEVDPLESVNVGEVMTTSFATVPAALSVKELVEKFFVNGAQESQGYPVVDGDGQVLGLITKSNLLDHWISSWLRGGSETHVEVVPIITYDLLQREPVTIFPWQSCREAAERMVQHGIGRLLVVAEDEPKRVVGLLTRADLLKPLARYLEEEERRERFIRPVLRLHIEARR